MEFKKILTTPTLAKQYLEANTRNRTPKTPVILRYANDILNDRWKEDTGETIKVSKNGNILDGQHRLMAIVKANKAIWLDFAFGLEESVFDVIDTGSKRNACDIFKIEGIKNSTKIPSMISFAHALKTRPTISQLNEKLTNAELLLKYEERPEYWQSISNNAHTNYLAFSKILNTSTIGGFLSMFYDINESFGLSFIVQLCTGQGITNNTIAVLRQKLIQDKLSVKRFNSNVRNAMIIKAWNAFVDGKVLKSIKFDFSKEKFPEISTNIKPKVLNLFENLVTN